MIHLAISQVAVEISDTRLFSDVTFTITRGDRWAIVGRNGSGKTTLLRILAGKAEPTEGAASRPASLRISVMEQHRRRSGSKTVWEGAAGAFADLLALERSLAEQAAAMTEAGERCTAQMLAHYDRDLERFEREGGYTVAARVDAVLHGLGFDPDDARTRELASLSGGERGRVELACQLLTEADLLLLDEPTNHLDIATTEWLEEYLRGLDATVVVISHDRAFLQAVVDHVLHLEAGTAFAYDGAYDAFIRQRAERRLTQARAHAKQARVIAAEEDFIRRNIAGQLSAQAKGRRRRLARVSRLSPPPGEQSVMALRLDVAERGGDQVLVLDRVSLGFGDRVLVRDFSASVRRGEVVGFVGPNGAGKSTLLQAIAGERRVDAGTLRVPESVRVAHYRQDLGQVRSDRTIYDVIADLRPGWGRGAVHGHLGRFGFSGDVVLRKAGTLSGGEQARVALAMMMLSGANLLLFDEPTNHLDVESIEALEDALELYEGTVVLVSHDRALLRALTTRTWVLHEGHVTDYPGGFAEWETASAERAHAAAVAAAEQESLRRVRERKQTRRPGEERKRGQAVKGTAERALAAAETKVAECEARLAAVEAQLGDPELYVGHDSAIRSARLGRELEAARAALDRALIKWESLASRG